MKADDYGNSIEEQFTEGDVRHAIRQWLDFGEESFGSAHVGYFRGAGWAARVLRYHFSELSNK